MVALRCAFEGVRLFLDGMVVFSCGMGIACSAFLSVKVIGCELVFSLEGLEILCESGFCGGGVMSCRVCEACVDGNVEDEMVVCVEGMVVCVEEMAACVEGMMVCLVVIEKMGAGDGEVCPIC